MVKENMLLEQIFDREKAAHTKIDKQLISIIGDKGAADDAYGDNDKGKGPRENFDRCHAKQKHYSTLLREKPHLRQSISDIMNGKYSGSDMEMFMYHPYSPKIQRDLRTCHATQVIPLLAIGYKSPTEINPNEGHLTMSYAIDAYTKGQSKLKPW